MAFLAEFGIDEFCEIVGIMMERKRKHLRAGAGPDKWALEGRLLLETALSRVSALSPSDATLRGGPTPLPTGADRARIVARAGRSYCTAAVRTPKTKLHDSTARKLAKIVAPNLHSLESAMGHVRVRLTHPNDLTVELFGEARQLANAG